jgi:hypothetical protein
MDAPYGVGHCERCTKRGIHCRPHESKRRTKEVNVSKPAGNVAESDSESDRDNNRPVVWSQVRLDVLV